MSNLKAHAPLQMRVGIATGLVVVGDLVGSGASQEQAIVGETPNLAARLQGVKIGCCYGVAPLRRMRKSTKTETNAAMNIIAKKYTAAHDIYRSTGLAAPTHNGTWQFSGVSLGEPYHSTPSPDRDVDAVRALAVPHPPTPRCTACCLIRAKAQEPRARTTCSGFSCLSLALAEPCPRLTKCAQLFWGSGNGCRAKNLF